MGFVYKQESFILNSLQTLLQLPWINFIGLRIIYLIKVLIYDHLYFCGYLRGTYLMWAGLNSWQNYVIFAQIPSMLRCVCLFSTKFLVCPMKQAPVLVHIKHGHKVLPTAGDVSFA